MPPPRRSGKFGAIEPNPPVPYSISMTWFVPDGTPEAGPALLLGIDDDGVAVSVPLDDEEASDEGGPVGGANENLLAALGDDNRLYVGKQGGDRVLVFDQRTGAALGVIDAPRLRAITCLLNGHVAIHADGAVFIFDRGTHIVAEFADVLLDGVCRMAFDAVRGRILCLVYDANAEDDSDRATADIIAINCAQPAMLHILLPRGVVEGHTTEVEERADREAAAAAAAAAKAQAAQGRAAKKVGARMKPSAEGFIAASPPEPGSATLGDESAPASASAAAATPAAVASLSAAAAPAAVTASAAAAAPAVFASPAAASAPAAASVPDATSVRAATSAPAAPATAATAAVPANSLEAAAKFKASK